MASGGDEFSRGSHATGETLEDAAPTAEVGERRAAEEAFWRDSDERPEADSTRVLLNKAREAFVFWQLLERYRESFARAGRILELGSGQGWASCIVKREFPRAHVVASDLSALAIAGLPRWERIYDVKLDETFAAPADELPLPDRSVDMVFCFAAAHHFVVQARTLDEVFRVLAPGGECLYLFEPSTHRLLHRLARARVERKRPTVPEDVLIYSEIAAAAQAAGFSCELDFYPAADGRGSFETMYYTVLARTGPLKKLLPCTVNYRFSKALDGAELLSGR